MSATATGTAPLPQLGSRAETFPARVIGSLTDPREDPTDEAILLHLVDRRGATIVHTLDPQGRLHRTDGPAVVRIGHNGHARRSWWISGIPLDNAPGPITFLPSSLDAGTSLSAQEAQALTHYLPRGFKADKSGRIAAPCNAANLLRSYDVEVILERNETHDPIEALARAITPV